MDIKKQIVVIISANELLAGQVRGWLVEAGYRVVMTRDGKSGLEIAHTLRPDLVVLDGNLPDLSNLAVIRAIRMDTTLDRSAFILLAQDEREEDRLLGLDAGADLCLAESLHQQVFIARVRAVLRRLSVQGGSR